MGWDGNVRIAHAIYPTYSEYEYASKDISENFSIIVLAILFRKFPVDAISVLKYFSSESDLLSQVLTICLLLSPVLDTPVM